MQSYKHKSTRPHIPSKEEAGMEQTGGQKQTNELSLTPVHTRGQDPELYWMHKYGPDGKADTLEVDIRSLYRHEHISPEMLIRKLYKQEQPKPGETSVQGDLFSPAPSVRDLFGNALEMDEMEKVGSYYKHAADWTNRLIQGDSLLVMNSLLEREGLAGKVQMMYFDPPYGIKYGSNWQIKLNERDVKDGSDDHLSAEPEQIKAFRDTWELGIHSYLTYLRDRLLVARELLTDSGSCFVQISDENVHLVRCLMDEVFGSGNYISEIQYFKTAGFADSLLATINDTIIWYAKSKEVVKYNQLFLEKNGGDSGSGVYSWVELENGERRRMNKEEKETPNLIPKNSKIFRIGDLTSQGWSEKASKPIFNEGQEYPCSPGRHWTVPTENIPKLFKLGRVVPSGKTLAFIRYIDDFPAQPINNVWQDTGTGSFTENKVYVVQSGVKAIQRCLLMTTDPGDLVLDPTCGSGTTAHVAEQWGRRWITIDTSRIALNIAKTRLMTAVYPYYHLYSDVEVLTKEEKGKIKKSIAPKTGVVASDLRQGFVYEEVPHITLKSLANDEPPETETLYDKPYEDKSRLRVAGPFTVETLQNFEPIAPEQVGKQSDTDQPAGAAGNFEERIFAHLMSAGIKNGNKQEQAIFNRVERLNSPFIHAEGYYQTTSGDRKAYLHIGPQFGTVSRQHVNEANKECRSRGDADWLIILGFSFESDISNQNITMQMGSFEVTKVRMHDDLLQEGLTKKDKKAASFVTIGEPDVKLLNENGHIRVQIEGLDIYDPIRDEVRSRSLNDIAYWMVDDDYDGSNFIVRQVFFCGGDKDEFAKWRKGLENMAKETTKRKAERTLKIELDDEAWELLYGFTSHPIPATPGRRIAVRVVSQFGEESMKVVG